MAIMRGAEPFLLSGGERGVLLVHGFTGSPSEMRPLGEHLHQLGYTVLGPRLAGHGSCPEEMDGTAWTHWYADVEDGYCLLKGICKEIFVVGLSMGGLLTLKLAAEYPVAKLVSVNAPIRILDRRLPFLPMYRLFRRYALRKRREQEREETCNAAYDHVPLSALASLLALIKQMDSLLPRIDRPALLIQSRHEHTVQPDSVLHIHSLLGSRDKQIIWLERSGHVATLDVEREQVFRYIADFFAAMPAKR